MSTTDSVGTKVKVSAKLGLHKNLGIDIVNHCINDLIPQGAKPLFFLDYLAFASLNEKIVLDTPLLFNLDEDPSEKHNIAEKYPEKVEEIKLIAQNHINSFNPPKSLLESRNSEKF